MPQDAAAPEQRPDPADKHCRVGRAAMPQDARRLAAQDAGTRLRAVRVRREGPLPEVASRPGAAARVAAPVNLPALLRRR